jgi:hypothetical protein
MFRAKTRRSARSTGDVEYVGAGVDGPARSVDKSRDVVASTEDDEDDDDDDDDSAACVAMSRPRLRATTALRDDRRGDERAFASRVGDGRADLEVAEAMS